MRDCEILVFDITQNLSPKELAERFDVSRSTVDRVLDGFLVRRPVTIGKRSGDLSEGIFRRYQTLNEKLTVESTILNEFDPTLSNVATVVSLYRLQREVTDASRQLDRLVCGPDHKLATASEIEEDKSNDVLKTMRRTLTVFNAPKTADKTLVKAVLAIGPQQDFPNAPSRVERNIRLTLLRGATSLTQKEVAEAFGLTPRQARHVEASTLAKHPEVGEWAAWVKQQLAEWDGELKSLDSLYPLATQPVKALERQLQILVRKQLTLARLGALPSAHHQDHEDRCTDLKRTITKVCKKHKLPDECHAQLTLIATAWTRNKKLPAGVPPMNRSTQG